MDIHTLYRYINQWEWKYIIDNDDYNSIIEWINTHGTKDVHCGLDGTYTTRTSYLSIAETRRNEQKQKHKLRLRQYFRNQNYEACDIEIKTSQQHRVSKIRINVGTLVDVKDITLKSEQVSKLLETLDENTRTLIMQGVLEQKLVVEYKREAWAIPMIEDVRITFDRDVYANHGGNLEQVRLCHPNIIIMEIKYDKNASKVLKAISSRGFKATSHSKFKQSTIMLEKSFDVFR